MFEKIIKEIEKEQEMSSWDIVRNDIVALDHEWMGWARGTNYAIDILKEEEGKVFNPESFGFNIIQFDSPDYKSWVNDKEDNIYLFKTDNVYNISVRDSIKKLHLIGRFMKISSNFEGEIILKALGIIE